MLNGECKAEKNIVKFFLYISEIFHEIFQGKKFHEILHHYLLPPPSAASPGNEPTTGSYFNAPGA